MYLFNQDIFKKLIIDKTVKEILKKNLFLGVCFLHFSRHFVKSFCFRYPGSAENRVGIDENLLKKRFSKSFLWRGGWRPFTFREKEYPHYLNSSTAILMHF